MAGTIHDGIVDDDRVYTTQALARIFGIKQPRTVERWLEQMGCPMKTFGSRVFVSGHEFRLSIERYANGGADLLCEDE
jgi:aminopeptidase N